MTQMQMNQLPRYRVPSIQLFIVSAGSLGDPVAYADEADALLLINAHSHSAAVAIAAELPALFNGTAQVRHVVKGLESRV